MATLHRLSLGRFHMLGKRYEIQLPLPDGVNYYTVCTCESLNGVIAVIQALLDCGAGAPGEIRIVVRAMD